jgi:tetratricopeptide (TPR) repeat protein
MFSLPLRWHANPINARWRPVERRSQRILRFCLGKGFVGLSRIRALGSHLPPFAAVGAKGHNFINTCFNQVFTFANACFNLAFKFANACFNLSAAVSRTSIRIVRRIGGSLDSWEQYQERGIRRDRRRSYRRAAEDFAIAIQIGPPNPALHFLRGCTLLRAADRQGAAAEFEAGLKLDPNNVTLRDLLDRTVWEAHQERGIQRDTDGDHLGAAEEFAQAIRVAPANPALHFLRGTALLNAADRVGAAAEFEAALKLDPNNASVRSLLDRTMREAEERGLQRESVPAVRDVAG